MVITNKDQYFCYMIISVVGTDAVRNHCLEKACAHCIVRKIKKELDGSDTEINIKPGMEIGLAEEYEAK